MLSIANFFGEDARMMPISGANDISHLCRHELCGTINRINKNRVGVSFDPLPLIDTINARGNVARRSSSAQASLEMQAMMNFHTIFSLLHLRAASIEDGSRLRFILTNVSCSRRSP